MVAYLRARDQRRAVWLVCLVIAACIGGAIGYDRWQDAKERRASEDRVDRLADDLMCADGYLPVLRLTQGGPNHEHPSRPRPGSLAPPEAVAPCPHCRTRVGTRYTERTITRPRRITFGTGWMLATVIGLFALIIPGLIVIAAYFIWWATAPKYDVVGIDRFQGCIACGGPR